jgi:hypothetical protein
MHCPPRCNLRARFPIVVRSNRAPISSKECSGPGIPAAVRLPLYSWSSFALITVRTGELVVSSTNLASNHFEGSNFSPRKVLWVGRNRYWTLVHHNPVLEPKLPHPMDVETLRPTPKVLLSSSPGSPRSFPARLPWFPTATRLSHSKSDGSMQGLADPRVPLPRGEWGEEPSFRRIPSSLFQRRTKSSTSVALSDPIF